MSGEVESTIFRLVVEAQRIEFADCMAVIAITVDQRIDALLIQATRRTITVAVGERIGVVLARGGRGLTIQCESKAGEEVSFPVEGFDGGSISMLTVQIG